MLLGQDFTGVPACRGARSGFRDPAGDYDRSGPAQTIARMPMTSIGACRRLNGCKEAEFSCFHQFDDSGRPGQFDDSSVLTTLQWVVSATAVLATSTPGAKHCGLNPPKMAFIPCGTHPPGRRAGVIPLFPPLLPRATCWRHSRAGLLSSAPNPCPWPRAWTHLRHPGRRGAAHKKN